MRHLICSIGLVAAASPALAACPVAADMERGLRLGLATGEVEEVTRGTAEGETRSRFIVEGYVSEVRLGQGVFPLEVREEENGTEVATPTTYRYATPLPAPAPGLEVSLELVVEGDETRQERHDYSFGTPVTWTYGSCAYEVIPVRTVHFRDGTEVSRDSLHYLVAFGHSYLAGYSDGESEDVYTYVSVEAMP
ncbi:hypothetical protein [Vannielia litorea]|uniref:Lipoprotein n=1 Tax=Vannielia litorea TaxID=1217970 RepID=A0A1N6E8Q5_9RHOB|nr:hypothetical protein [Vannielia litorea]SIN79408.1 hypothetical protein SAMN05444002_0463 [Vannielia litorea]